MLKNLNKLLSYRELLFSLTSRDIKVRYKQSLLGVGWAILQPLALMIVFTIVFSRFARISTGDIPYPIFSYCALLPWTFFTNSLTFAIPSLVNNINLVTKIYFPREIFPIAAVAACFLDFIVASVIFVGLMIYYKVTISTYLLLLPLIVIIQIFLTLGVAFFLSAINVFFRDVRYIIPLGLQIWMFISPVIYPLSSVPERFQKFYILNPMAGIIDAYRSIILTQEIPPLGPIGIASIFSLGLFLFSYRFFKKLEMRFADVI